MTPAEILERTQWDLFWLPSGASSVQRPELAYSHSRLDRPFLNVVVRTRLAPEQVPAAIEEVGRAHEGVTGRWMVADGTRPIGIERALTAAGYEPSGDHRGAVLPVGAWPPISTGHTVRRVGDAAALEALYDVIDQAFGPRRPSPDALAEELAACADPAGRVHRFVAFDPAGTPVAAGGLTAFPDLGFGLLWAGGTVPSARGRGAYRAILEARVGEARRLGLAAVGLYARVATSWPIVTRLGFETHGSMAYWDRAARMRPDVLVAESFDLAGRGVAAVFEGARAGLPLGRRLQVRVSPPSGAPFVASATVELGRRTDPDREFAAILVAGHTASEVPPGSTLAFLSADPG